MFDLKRSVETQRVKCLKVQRSLQAEVAFVAQLAARGSHNPKVAGSIPVESSYLLPVSLGGQDTRLSPERPGFNSRSGNIFLIRLNSVSRLKKQKRTATNGIRTHDLSLTKRVLYQLSYSGTPMLC